MKKIVVTLALIVYLIAYNVYVYLMYTEPIKLSTGKLMNYYPILFLSSVVFYVKTNKYEYYTKNVLSICKFVLISTFAIIILTNHLLIKNPYTQLHLLDGSTFLFTLFVLISGLRHGYFKKDGR